MKTGLIGFSAVKAPRLKLISPEFVPVPPSGKMSIGGNDGFNSFWSTRSEIASTAFYFSSPERPLGTKMQEAI